MEYDDSKRRPYRGATRHGGLRRPSRRNPAARYEVDSRESEPSVSVDHSFMQKADATRLGHVILSSQHLGGTPPPCPLTLSRRVVS